MPSLADALLALLSSRPQDLAGAALCIARVDAPHLDPGPSLAHLDDLGRRAEARLATCLTIPDRIAALNNLLFGEEGFRGNRAHYDDVRNSLIDAVLERRLGIPITLAVVYMTVARRAGLEVFGVAFPGHFLLRVPAGAGDEASGPIILDPFDAGRQLGTPDLVRLLALHADTKIPFNTSLLAPCTNRQIIVRMLHNLKRQYVHLRAFPQAFAVTDAIVALDPTDRHDLRDRGLLAYHLDDVRGALRDLEAYLRAGRAGDESDEDRQIREHVTTLRRRVAGLN